MHVCWSAFPEIKLLSAPLPFFLFLAYSFGSTNDDDADDLFDDEDADADSDADADAEGYSYDDVGRGGPKARRKKSGGWKTKSSYGQVADVGISDGGGTAVRDFDPWDQLRMQSVKGDAEAMTQARKNVASQQAARTTFKPSIRSKSHPLISHCRKIMREQARKREGVMRVEGVKLILTALEYGWEPEVPVETHALGNHHECARGH